MPNSPVDLLKARLAEVERDLAPLIAERDQLTAGIKAMEAAAPAPARASRRRTAAVSRRNGTRSARRRTARRARRGANREKILATVRADPMTASDVEKATGIPSATAATTLNQMARKGELRKAARGSGYVAA